MNMAFSASIDLVICTYNRATFLNRTLNAIGELEKPKALDWGCLIIDNNCTDNTADIVENHIRSCRIPNLRRKVEKQQGLTSARLCGFKNSPRDWIAFVDDDCILSKNWLIEAYRFLESRPSCGAFGGRVILDYEVEPPTFLLRYGYCYAEQNLGEHQIETNFLVGAGIVASKNALIHSGWSSRQLLQDRIGAKLISGGDVEMVLRIRSAGYKLWYVPGCILLHSIPRQRMSKKYLININYNLGISQTYADAMEWPSSYRKWRIASLNNFLANCRRIYRLSYRFASRKLGAMDFAIGISFICGQSSGYWKLLNRNSGVPASLLGCARSRQKADVAS